MAQKLILPFRRSVLSAAYKNTRYREYHKIIHYGWDMGCDEVGYAILACGDGIVVAAGMDGTSRYGAGANLGNCIVIVYSDVMLADGKVTNVACRMFHLERIDVRMGQTVHAGTRLGDYGDTYARPCGKHLHIEFDTDTEYPSHAVGVAQSGKVIKRGTIDSTIDPAGVLYLGAGQSIRGCPGDNGLDWYSERDIELGRADTREVCPTCGREIG